MQPKYWENITHLPTKPEQLEEFRKKFSCTYMFIESAKLKNKKLIYIQDVDVKNGRIYAQDLDNGIDYNFLYESDLTLSCAFPSAKFVNTGNTVCYFSRHPARQYYKAPNNHNVSIYHLLYKTNYELASILKEAYYPTYFSFEEAYKLLKTGKYLGRAINPDFALTLVPDTDNYFYLYYIDVVVGFVFEDKISLVNEIFRQEIEDFLHRNRITKWKIQ